MSLHLINPATDEENETDFVIQHGDKPVSIDNISRYGLQDLIKKWNGPRQQFLLRFLQRYVYVYITYFQDAGLELIDTYYPFESIPEVIINELLERFPNCESYVYDKTRFAYDFWQMIRDLSYAPYQKEEHTKRHFLVSTLTDYFTHDVQNLAYPQITLEPLDNLAIAYRESRLGSVASQEFNELYKPIDSRDIIIEAKLKRYTNLAALFGRLPFEALEYIRNCLADSVVPDSLTHLPILMTTNSDIVSFNQVIFSGFSRSNWNKKSFLDELQKFIDKKNKKINSLIEG